MGAAPDRPRPAPRARAHLRGRRAARDHGRARHLPGQRLPAPFTRPQGPCEAQGAIRRMSTTDQLLSEFIDAWNAGRRPRVREYLARLPDGPDRDELAEQLSTWLEVAPTPDYDNATRARIAAEPTVAQVV